MQNPLTSNRIGGRAVGALFFAGFGALWLVLALYAKQWLTVDSGIAVACGAGLLVFGALALLRRARALPTEPENPALGRAFRRINIFQWIAVAVVAFTFARLHIDAYVISAITAIVGLHMLPLARLFHYPMHYATGTSLILWATVSALDFPIDAMQGSTALGTGIILWLSALGTILLAVRLLRAGAAAEASDSGAQPCG